MPHSLRRLLVFLMIVWVFAPFFEETGLAENPVYVEGAPQGAHHVLILGDSMTVSDCNGDDGVTPTKDGRCGWRRFLSAECGKDANYYSFDTLSKIGVTAALHDRWINEGKFAGKDDTFIRGKSYEAVVILLGANDLNEQGQVVERAKQSYTKLLATLRARLKTPTPPIAFVSVLPSCRTKETAKLSSNIVSTNAYLKSLETASGLSSELPTIRFLDIYPKLVEPGTGCLAKEIREPDQLHPKATQKAQHELARFIADAMRAKKLLGCGQAQ